MWRVVSGFSMYDLVYYVEHSETGERKGMFDREEWAREFAKSLNKMEEKRDVAKGVTE